MSNINTIEANLKELELNALLEVTEAINNNLPEASLYKIYHFTLLANLKVKKLALFVMGEEKWQCPVNFGVNSDHCSQIDLLNFEKLSDSRSLQKEDDCGEFEHVIPVHHKGKLLALVFVGDIMDIGASNNSATTFLEALTNIILVAIENKKLARQQLEQEAMKKELEIAQQVQNYLFPKNLPDTDDFEVAATYLPHHNVGGDYYDCIEIDEDQFLLCIADVSGKGIPAALMMSNFQASLRTLVRQSNDLKKIVSELNYQIKFSGNGEIFITFFAALYNKKTRQLKYVNCGHNPPLLNANNEGYKELTLGGTVLGMFNPLPFLELGELNNINEFLLFCYTDGLNEAVNESDVEFGESNINDILNSLIGKNAKQINSEMINAVDAFRNGQDYRDDVTILSTKYNS